VEKVPQFYLNLELLVYRKDVKCRVLMIKCCEEDEMELKLLFKGFKDYLQCKFNPWKEYLDMVNGKRVTLIENQTDRQNKFTSFVVEGFLDNGTVTMNYESKDSDMMDEHPSDNPYANLTISAFIREKYKNYNNEPIVKICYEPINGARELIVKNQNYNEAEELCKCLKLDIGYHMTGDAANKTFSNHMEMIQQMEYHTPWESYKLSEDYATKDVESYKKDHHGGTKRVKTTSPEDSNLNPEDKYYDEVLLKGKKRGVKSGDVDKTNFSSMDVNEAMMKDQWRLMQETQRELEAKTLKLQEMIDENNKKIETSITKLTDSWNKHRLIMTRDSKKTSRNL
jgi:hypothetical protein